MKAPLLPALLCGSGIAFAAYTLDWSTLDGGGGESRGGAYTVAGTIGQPDAGIMSGGTYTVTGGFWSMPELLQTPGGPPLEFTTAGGITYLRWPAPSPGWRLESSGDAVSWTVVPGVPAPAGDFLQLPVDVLNGASRRLFRLNLP